MAEKGLIQDSGLLRLYPLLVHAGREGASGMGPQVPKINPASCPRNEKERKKLGGSASKLPTWGFSAQKDGQGIPPSPPVPHPDASEGSMRGAMGDSDSGASQESSSKVFPGADRRPRFI